VRNFLILRVHRGVHRGVGTAHRAGSRGARLAPDDVGGRPDGVVPCPQKRDAAFPFQGCSPDGRRGRATVPALDLLLRQHQGVERLHRGGLLLLGRVLHRASRAHHQPAPLLRARVPVQHPNGMWRLSHLPIRHPIPFGHCPRNCLLGLVRPVRHRQPARRQAL